MSDIRVMWIAIDSTVLDSVLKHATSAAQRIGHIDNPALDALADDIDTIVHELGALLGHPHLRCSTMREAQAPYARPLVRRIVELETLGWHVVGLRPSRTGDEPTLWSVTIKRYDEGASMTSVEVDPDLALANLLRYARVDAA
jgi:hypothetical protein